jgi:uncharacterized membrane protein YoaK (UPF0700 family)
VLVRRDPHAPCTWLHVPPALVTFIPAVVLAATHFSDILAAALATIALTASLTQLTDGLSRSDNHTSDTSDRDELGQQVVVYVLIASH